MANKNLEPIIVWGHWGAPNPWKVLIILKELDVPFDHRIIELSDVKGEPLLSVNPNGRLPAIEDPNTGMRLWESGAIILYLIEQYDTTSKLSFSTQQEKAQTQQWLFFQVSGQGPYFGQLAWFLRFHAEKLPSAIDRYAKETERVIGVLESWLMIREWLVGDKCSYADLSFVTWCHVAEGIFKQLGRSDISEKYPRYTLWLQAMNRRASVKEAVASIAAARAAHGLPP